MLSKDTLKVQSSNVRATNAGGIRTGNKKVEVAPVKVWVGPGPTTLPQSFDDLLPKGHPEPRQD